MPLAPATRLGPYEIVSPLGAGGMGEVYRARDARLGREVAIKVLPAHLSADPELRSRFEREAKTISSLNHPHICTLHDVGREGDTDYLVMELVEGETLAQRLERGAMPVPDVLRIGGEIADALDRAHRLGVVHRDLKPANIMLTRSGAKLMDFGLARPVNTSVFAAGDGLTVAAPAPSRPVSEPLTARGTFVGTFLYMSPEQLEGQEADTRSDIWALGCVLYEMATGKRAFDGKSQASIVGAIMGSDPTPVSQVSALAPATLDRLIRDCLRKDPGDRIQTAHDVRLRLADIREGQSQAGAPGFAKASRASGAWVSWAIAALALAGLVWSLLTRKEAPEHAVQLSLTPPAGAQFTTYSSPVAISPDGSAVAFSAIDTSGHYGVWLRRLDAAEPIRLTGTENIALLFWSPDSRTVGYTDFTARNLATIPANGGTPSVLAKEVGAGRGASWSPKGVIVYQPRTQGPLYRVPAAGGEPQQASWLDSTRHEATHRFPCFLPDGEHFLFVSLPPGPDGYDVYAGSLSSRAVKKVMTADSAPNYAPPGYLVFRRGGKIMAQSFDAGGLRLRGSPFAIGDAPEVSGIDAEPVASASRNGRLVYLSARSTPNQLLWLDRTGAVTGGLALPPDDWARPVLSPDGRFAVCRNGTELWRVDLGRAVALRLASGELNSSPAWSPDGQRIAFALSHEGTQEIQEIPSDGSGEAKVIPTSSDLFKWPEDWAKAGLVFMSIGKDTQRDLWLLPSEGGSPRPLLRSGFSEWGARVSPDGHWMAYICNEGGSDDVYLQSFPDLGHKVRVSTTGASRIWWMPSSAELCYRSGDQMVSVPLAKRGVEMDPGAPKVLFRYPQEVEESDFTRDGRRILISAPVPGAQKRKLGVILDWTALEKR